VPELSRFFGIIIRMFAEAARLITMLISTRTAKKKSEAAALILST
jgi:hypothetical protein